MAAPETFEVLVPDIGEFDEVEIVEVLVSPGDTVERDASLVTLESDKASMDIPAPGTGKVVAVQVSVGDMVGEGALIATLDLAEETAAQPAAAVQTDSVPELAEAEPEPNEAEPLPPLRGHDSVPHAPPSSPRRPPPVVHTPDATSGHPPAHASPSVRRFARELGVDLGKVTGSGRKGRIGREDVQSFTRRALASGGGGGGIPAVPSIDFARFGEVEEVPLSRIRRIAKDNLHRSWLNVPHVTQHDLADITELEAFRQGQRDEAARREVKLTPLPILMRACAAALAEFPRVNSSLGPNGDSLIYKRYCHLGIAVDTEDGLVVPVIRDVDTKGLFELAGELTDAGGRARTGKLQLGELHGASFTISSLGGIGGSFFTPIVNAPEVAILGVGRAQMQPVWRDGEPMPRLMLPLSLSYDHRVVDGAEAARFITFLSALLGDIRRLLL